MSNRVRVEASTPTVGQVGNLSSQHATTSAVRQVRNLSRQDATSTVVGQVGNLSGQDAILSYSTTVPSVPSLSRRKMLKLAAAAGGASLASRLGSAPAVLADRAPNSLLATAVIGCANQGISSLNAAAGERLVALVDVDDSHLGKAQQFLAEQHASVKWSGIKTWFDYRQMFDQMHDKIDAVFIATPDHHHAVAAMMAMELDKHVYVEKPMGHTIDEARQLTEAARKHKVMTQMGNQGHSGEGIRRLCEYIWAGAIGNLLETHSWAPTGRGGVGGRPPSKPVPAGLHWDEWIGPATYRDYHDELHPLEWRSWWDFGEGSIGDWGCHNLDAPFMVLRAESPTGAEAIRQEGGSDERFPLLNVIRWDFPRPGGGEPVHVHWYDGYASGFDPKLKDDDPETAIRFQNRPPIVAELEKKYGRELKNGGTIYVGTEGVMYTGNYAGSPRIIPEEKHRAFPVPERKIPRIKGTHQDDFLRACKDGQPSSADFNYSGPLTEMVLLGCLAIKAGVGKLVQWDSQALRCSNLPELNTLVKREYRKGWEL